MVQAALLLREKKEKGKEAGAKADELLSAYAAQHQGQGVASRVQLMRAQIAAAAGNWKRAAAALQAVPTLAARGAVVATTGTYSRLLFWVPLRVRARVRLGLGLEGSSSALAPAFFFAMSEERRRKRVGVGQSATRAV